MAKKKQPDGNIVARNRKARHNYFIEDNIEAGLVLVGTEVKSLRSGRASIEESYAAEQDGELFLVNAYIPKYQAGRQEQHETRRPRKLLLRKREMAKLAQAVAREGMTIVPLSVYFNERGIAKADLGIAKGKRQYDKRATAKDRDWKRQQGRIMRGKG
jgi:SsrA-binding protein